MSGDRHTSSAIVYRMTVATIVAAVTLVIALALCGCTSTRYVPVERVTHHTDTVTRHTRTTDTLTLFERIYESDTRYDSIAPILDSLNRVIGWDRYHFREVTKKDEREMKRLQSLVDSLMAVRQDSIDRPVPYPVERKLTAWERVKQDTGGWALAAVAVLAVAVAWLAKRQRKR